MVGSQCIYSSGGSSTSGSRASRDPARHVLVDLTPDAWEAVKAGRAVIDDVLARKEIAYGIKSDAKQRAQRAQHSSAPGTGAGKRSFGPQELLPASQVPNAHTASSVLSLPTARRPYLALPLPSLLFCSTGFGNFANVIIADDELEALQANLIRSHAAGVGMPLSPAKTRMLSVAGTRQGREGGREGAHCGCDIGRGRALCLLCAPPRTDRCSPPNRASAPRAPLGCACLLACVRAACASLALRVNVLAKGHSGIRVETVQRMLAALNANCLPLVPSKGTVGASGDLAPLSHLALGLMGEGKMVRLRTRTRTRAVQCRGMEWSGVDGQDCTGASAV